MGSMLTPDVERFKASHTDGLLVSPFENDEMGRCARLALR